MRKKAAKAGKLDGADVYSGQAYEAIIEKLKDAGIEPNLLLYLASAGKETGHNSLKDFVSLDDDRNVILNPERSDAEKAVHIADDMTHSSFPKEGKQEKTFFVTCNERMELSDFPKRYPFLYIEGFGFDKEGNTQIVRDIQSDEAANLSQVKTYAEWQVIVAKMIAKDIQQRKDPENKQDPELYLCDIANH